MFLGSGRRGENKARATWVEEVRRGIADLANPDDSEVVLPHVDEPEERLCVAALSQSIRLLRARLVSRSESFLDGPGGERLTLVRRRIAAESFDEPAARFTSRSGRSHHDCLHHYHHLLACVPSLSSSVTTASVHH
jgi:hypothetical protein